MMYAISLMICAFHCRCLFADDFKLYTVYKLDASHNDLQVAVNRLTDWARSWQLQIAIPKCTRPTFHISNQQWEVSESLISI